MRSLVRRYITNEQRTAERQRGVTEDDCNEIKQDISALRFELIEILGGRLLNASIPVEPPGSASLTLLGKRGRKRERRLIKGFDFDFLFRDTYASFDDQDVSASPPADGNGNGAVGGPVKIGPDGKIIKSPPSTTRNKFVRLARGLAGKRVVRANKWKQLIEATRSKVIPFSRSTESVNSIGNPRSPTTAPPGSKDTQPDDEWKTQEEEETPAKMRGRYSGCVGATASSSKKESSPEERPSQVQERRHSQIHDFDLSVKRSIFARKVTTLIRDAPDLVSSRDVVLQEPVTFNKCHPTAKMQNRDVRNEEKLRRKGNETTTTAESAYESRKRESSSPEGTCSKSYPRLMVTHVNPQTDVESQESNDVNPSGDGAEEEQLRVSKRIRKKSKTHGSRTHRTHRRVSRSRSPSKSPSKSPSPQSLNASVLIGLTQTKEPHEWI